MRSIHRRPIERSSRISLLPFQKRQAVIKSAKGKFHPVGVVAGISSALSPALRIASQQFPSFQLARSFPPNCPRIAVGVLSDIFLSYIARVILGFFRACNSLETRGDGKSGERGGEERRLECLKVDR